MTNEIKIFNSETEAKGLEGTLVENLKIKDETGFLEDFCHIFLGNFTDLQRLKYTAKQKAKKLNADYGIITNKYHIDFLPRSYIEWIQEYDNLTIEVDFYKNKK